MKDLDRRDFLKKTTAAAGLAMAGATVKGFAAGSRAPLKTVKIGIVGTGGRGRSLLGMLLSIEDVRIPAVCDIDPQALAVAQNMVTQKGQPKPEGYSGPTDYKKLMDRDDLDAVLIATPWHLHTSMAVYSMKAGKMTGCEVPIAYTLDECWQLIKTWEQTGTPCMQLENWSFRSDNLAVLRMIREGLLGQIVHCHCAHSHDCIDHWFFDRQTGSDRWPAKYLVEHNRDQYPTHQQGPVLSWMDINCGDYYDTITSTATDCFGINDYFIRKFGPDHPNSKRKYAQGDIVTTVVRTKKGKSLVINYDMQLPRPYDNRWMIQGTRGIYNEQRNAVNITGKSPKYHEWEPFDPYHEKYKHPWTSHSLGGHGGADGTMIIQFVKAVRLKKPLPLDLYDGVLMAAIGPLSEMSIAQKSKAIKVPDFTRGKWKTRKPFFAVET